MTILRGARFARLLRMFPPALLQSGCTRAPSVDVVGSFFPAWLVCLVVALVLTSFARLVLLRLHIRVALSVLIYPSLVAFLTFALWLIFFY